MLSLMRQALFEMIPKTLIFQDHRQIVSTVMDIVNLGRVRENVNVTQLIWIKIAKRAVIGAVIKLHQSQVPVEMYNNTVVIGPVLASATVIPTIWIQTALKAVINVSFKTYEDLFIWDGSFLTVGKYVNTESSYFFSFLFCK